MSESNKEKRSEPFEKNSSRLGPLPGALDDERQRALVLEYQRTHDPGIERRLLEANLRLVMSLALRHARRRGPSLSDLFQEGSLGLLVGIRRFDPTKNVRLGTYAAFWIKAFIFKHSMDNAGLVRTSSTRAGRVAFFRGIAGPSELSLDAPCNKGETQALVDRLPDARLEPADACLARRQLSQRAWSCAQRMARDLPPRDRAILQDRLLADAAVPLRSLAKRFAVSGECIRLAERRLLSALRAQLETGEPAAAAC
jgi:RNA polymerase sigma-32 factor